MCEKELLFRRQFVVGASPMLVTKSWDVSQLDAKFYLSADNLLVRNRAGTKDREILVLGHVFDTLAPKRSNQEVVDAIFRASTSFETFERATEQLAGRWIMFVRMGDKWRVYPDAGGLRSVFFGRVGNNSELWFCSQPTLIDAALNLQNDVSLMTAFQTGRRGNSWPCEVTPFVGIEQLLPNHYLDIDSGRQMRFWPGELSEYDLEDAAAEIGSMISGAIAAAAHRGPVALPVTGGYDSRVLLACAGDLRQSMRSFCLVDPTTSRWDVALAKKVGATTGVKVDLVRTQAFPEVFWQTYRRNVAEMVWDRSSIKNYTFCNYSVGHTVLTGGAGELGRCFFYKDGKHPLRIDATELARKAGFAGNPVATEAFDAWLARFPSDSQVSVLDLFYWEHRLGNWLSVSGNAFDAMIEVVQPFNCRRLISIALGTPVEYRRDPHELFRKICEIHAPETLQIGFNDHWSARVTDAFESILHWRIRRAWMRARVRMMGISHLEELG
jgi:hypothetical protein